MQGLEEGCCRAWEALGTAWEGPGSSPSSALALLGDPGQVTEPL